MRARVPRLVTVGEMGADSFPDPVCVPFSAGGVDRDAYAEWSEACARLRFLPAFRHGILLDAALALPAAESTVAAIRQLSHQEVRSFAITAEDFDRTMADLAASGLPPEKSRDFSAEPLIPPCPASWDFYRKSAREIAADLVQFAFSTGASDILLDEQEEWMDVAIKLAGQKEILPPVDKAHAGSLLNAFKEISGLSTQSIVAWQSGYASFPLGSRPGELAQTCRADLRVEITPTVHGESLVARLQDRTTQLRRMRQLPFANPQQASAVLSCLRRRQGLIVATGPAGHGKTTTLYACLGQLDRSALNIRTLEDPVEFTVPWITQIPVGAGTGRSFGDGLKSLLRQAPHVILMGEIRDRSVAQTCVEAVETGHLILATLHTRDAIGVVPRLLDLDLSGRQVASALTLAIAQRLLRRLCPHCRKTVPTTRLQARHFERHGLPVPGELCVPGGCPRCGERGERGLVPIFELFRPEVAGEFADLIARANRARIDEAALRARWMALGASPLAREGLKLAAQGEVSHEEVLKHERSPPAEAD